MVDLRLLIKAVKSLLIEDTTLAQLGEHSGGRLQVSNTAVKKSHTNVIDKIIFYVLAVAVRKYYVVKTVNINITIIHVDVRRLHWWLKTF